MNTKPLIAFFGSSKRLLRYAQQVAQEEDRNVKCYHCALDDAIAPAINAVEEDCAEVIIAYRGTVNMLKQSVHIPVLAVQNLNIYKIDAISVLRNHTRDIILPCTCSEDVNASSLSELFGINIHQVYYKNIPDLDEKLRQYRDRHREAIVVSGGMALRIARKYGFKHYLVVPPKVHIREVIDNAASIAAANRENELWVRSSEAILNNVSDGVLAVDNNGFITLCNKQAFTLLNLKDRVIGKNLRNVLPELTATLGAMHSRTYFIQQIGRTKFVFNYTPLEIRAGIFGALYTFNSARRVITGGKIVSRAVSQANRAKYTVQDYIHCSSVIDNMLTQLRLYASSNSTVLITGGSGTGKEILAHALHNCSPRRNKPFVSINCAAIPEQLLESELFGYEGGSFTGSLKEGKNGLFENADEGTIFIDEVNSLPSNVQLLLLRALQEKEIRRIGSDTVIPLNIRVIAATNKSLIDEVLKGRMREDLFFRLNVLVLDVPPLHRHAEDIPMLARHFARKSSIAGKLPLLTIPDESLERLKTLPWPGNTRELQHFIERLVLLCNGEFNNDVFEHLFNSTQIYQRALARSQRTDIPEPALPKPPVQQERPTPREETRSVDTSAGISRKAILDALRQCHGKKGLAAGILGVSRVTLWRLMQKHSINS